MDRTGGVNTPIDTTLTLQKKSHEGGREKIKEKECEERGKTLRYDEIV